MRTLRGCLAAIILFATLLSPTLAASTAAANRSAPAGDEAAAASRDLKRFLFAKVYASAALGGDRQQSMSAIAELFGYFLADLGRLPEGYADQAKENPPHRVVCDYIAGMTDGFFVRCFQQVFGARD